MASAIRSAPLRSPTKWALALATAALVGLPFAFSSSAQMIQTKAPLTGDEAAMTDAHRGALHAQLRQQYLDNYAKWVDNIDMSSLDLRSLPHQTSGALPHPGEPTMSAAAAKADLIVVGRVTSIRALASRQTRTAFAIEKTIKGATGTSIDILQDGGFDPTPTWDGTPGWRGIVITDPPNGALLLPGDRAALLLQIDPSGTVYIQSYSGWYQLREGAVVANSGSHFGRQLTGTPELTFVQQLESATNGR